MDAPQSAARAPRVVGPASRRSGKNLCLFFLLALCTGLLCFSATPLSAAAAPAGKKAVKSGQVAKAKDAPKAVKKGAAKKAETKHVAKKDEPKKDDRKRVAKRDESKKKDKKHAVRKDEPKKGDKKRVARKDEPKKDDKKRVAKRDEPKPADKKHAALRDDGALPGPIEMVLRLRKQELARNDAAKTDAPEKDGGKSVAQKARSRADEAKPPEKVKLRSGEEGPYVKRRASFDESTNLANVLRERLGLEVREDPGHSGGLYIAPPSIELEHAEKAMDLLANLPLGKPIAEEDITSVSSAFGGRQDPFKKRRRAFHEGIDFRAKRGVKVRATAQGKVVNSGYSPSYGENIILSHGQGYETMFAHLSKRLVKVGDEVRPGQLIGLVGSTGRSTGAHLHYEVRYEGAPIDPTDYAAADPQFLLQRQ